MELEDGRVDRLEEEREAPEDDERLPPEDGLVLVDDEDLGPIRLLRLDDVAPTVGRR